jgi:hypothetical protein
VKKAMAASCHHFILFVPSSLVHSV